MGRKVTKNPSWIQFTDEVWGEAIGPSKHDSFLDSLDDPELPASALESLPDANAPLLLTWMVEQALEQIEDDRRRVIGPHGPTFAKHADMQMEVANLDAARRVATGDLRDQITRQHREAKQELDDFERGDRFQKALRHYLEDAGPAFESIAAAMPVNHAAAVQQQQAAEKYEALKALASPKSKTGNGVTNEQCRPPEKRQRQQEQEILAVLRELGYNPKGLPPRKAGKAGVKSEVRANLPQMTDKVFSKAWERLREFRDIADAG